MKTKFTLEELIDNEAFSLAKTLLEGHLAKHDLPLPKESALEAHINQLLSTNPKIRETAKARVLASQDAYSESLRAIGLPVPELPLPIEIEL